MIAHRLAVLVGLLVAASPGHTFGRAGHQIALEASVQLAANDLGEDFAAALKYLEANRGTMNRAVVAPDNDPRLSYPPIFPSLFHAHEAFEHVGFDSLPGHSSELLAEPYCQSAYDKWNQADASGALFDLGCVLHLVQDASFSGHSNFLKARGLSWHKELEDWLEKQATTEEGEAKSLDDLYQDCWTIRTGGIYLKEGWRDPKGRPHWEGGLESWVDVAAHLSYNLQIPSAIEDHDACNFQGAAHQQFAIAQRCGAGLLVDFFRKVGIIEEPWMYYQRGEEMLRVRLGEETPEHLGSKDKLCPDDFWPTVSPDGKSRLRFGTVTVSGHDPDQAIAVYVPPCSVWTWQFDRLSWPRAPRRVGRAFYLNNYIIALTDAQEGDNWKHLYLIPAKPYCDMWFYCPKEEMLFPYRILDDLEVHCIQVVALPE